MKTTVFLFMFALLISMGICKAQTYVQVYTPNNSSVEGILLSELSDAEIQSINSQYINAYPQATFLGNASRTYNCHSYAWNMSTGGNTICWINANDKSGKLNVNKYWTDNSYAAVGENDAYKIHYYMGDHSAIRSSVAGYYESKWGQAPFMRHKPDYGPANYNMSYRNYYGAKVAISGPTTLYLTDYTASGEYMAKPYYKPVTGNYEWSVTGGGNPRIYPSGQYAGVEFQSVGIYYVVCSFRTNTGQTAVESRFKVSVLRGTYRLSYDATSKTFALIGEKEIAKSTGSNAFPYQIVNMKSGSQVRNGNIVSNGDKISLNELTSGIYVFSVQVDGETLLSEKIVIQ